MTDINSILVDGQDVNMPALRAYLDALAQQVVTVGRRAYMPRWSAALAEHRLGSAMARILVLGDSNARGIGTNPASAVADLVRRSWPTVMAQELSKMPDTTAYADSLWGDGFFGLTGSGNLAIADPRVSWEDGWTVNHPVLGNQFVLGGNAFHDPAGNSGSPKFNVDFGKPTKSARFYFVGFPGYATAIVSSDGSYFAGSIVTNAASGIVTADITRTVPDEPTWTGTDEEFFELPWTVQKAAGDSALNLTLVGVEAYNEEEYAIRVGNMGASGSTIGSWTNDNQPYSAINAIQVVQPDLTIICLNTNDAAANTNGVTYRTKYQTLIDAALVTGDVLLVIGIPSNAGTAPLDRQKAFADIVRELAETNGLPLVDLQARWISQSAFPERGFYFDGVHSSQKGAFDIGYTIAQIVGNPGVYLG